MKNLIKILIFLLISSNFLYSQVDSSCGTTFIPQEGIDLNQEGGIYLPSQGNLKVLVVFARFKNDNSSHPYWPVGGNPTNPSYTTWIDPSMQTGSTNVENITHYFKDMSLGVFNVTGTVISVETPNTMSYYGTAPNMNRYYSLRVNDFISNQKMLLLK